MNFVTALKVGSTPEIEGERCMKHLLFGSRIEGELSLVLTADFINELFKAIGLRTSITAQQLEAGKGFDWEAAGCRHYIFHCNTIFFSAFERFLMQLCRTVRDEQENATTYTNMEPTEYLLQVLAIWCNCYTDLLEQEMDMQIQYFQEPLARINYRLFHGVHKIRKKYPMRFQTLNVICARLLDSALQGLFFKECHADISDGLIILVEKHFAISEAFAEDAFKFFYCSFSVEQHKSTQWNIFKCFTRMLNKFAAQIDSNVYRKFLSFLIEKDMLEVYYTILKLEKTKRLLLAAISFLNGLQEQLLDLNCFSQTFLEAVLGLTLHADDNISILAAELYISIARRRASTDDFLLKHILEFYFTEMNTTDSLPRYIAAIWPNFSYMRSLDIYFELLKDARLPLEMRCFIAQFTIVIYSKMLAHTEKYAREILYVLRMLPSLLTLLDTQCLKGILLQLYSLTELELLRGSYGFVNNPSQLLIDFENYCIVEFKSDENFKYPYLLNLFMQFTRLIEETKNFHKIEMCAVYAYTQYKEIERSLPKIDEKKQPRVAQVRAYLNVLQKLCVLLQVDYSVLDTLEPLIRTLNARLVEKPQLQELASKYDIFIDVYAIELMVNCCIKLSSNKDLTKTSQQWLGVQIHVLETFLLDALTDAEVKTTAQLYRLKTYFICLVNLYCTFHNATAIYKLPLNLRPYHILVQTLLASCLQRKSPTSAHMQIVSEENLELHPKYVLQYQKLMLEKFTKLHSSKHVVLPSPAAWKLCLHYGLTSHKFNDELFTFMESLTKHHFKIFTHVSAVLVYNLYKQNPPFKMDVIMCVIRAQKLFIDQLPSALSPSLLCVNVVLQVLQILQQSLQKLPVTTGGNRLMALKHLNHYTWNLNVNGSNVLPDIRSQANALRNHMLNNAEQVCLDTFLSALNGYKTNAKGKA